MKSSIISPTRRRREHKRSGHHRVFDVCIPKWLNQAGAKDDFVRLEDAGIKGNMHEMFLDRNSDEVIKFIDGWMNKNIR